MQVGRCSPGIAGFTDIADDPPFFYSLIQADTGKFIQVGIVMPRTRPLDTDNFTAQSVAPDLVTMPDVVLRIGVFFWQKISTPSCLRP